MSHGPEYGPLLGVLSFCGIGVALAGIVAKVFGSVSFAGETHHATAHPDLWGDVLAFGFAAAVVIVAVVYLSSRPGRAGR